MLMPYVLSYCEASAQFDVVLWDFTCVTSNLLEALSFVLNLVSKFKTLFFFFKLTTTALTIYDNKLNYAHTDRLSHRYTQCDATYFGKKVPMFWGTCCLSSGWKKFGTCLPHYMT